jgi:hypothetical protein
VRRSLQPDSSCGATGAISHVLTCFARQPDKRYATLMPVKRKKVDAPLLFKTDAIVKGHVLPITAAATGHRLYYEHPNGRLYQGDSTDWLTSLAASSVDLVFADPPYNIRKAAWDSFDSQEAYIAWSLRWISQAARVLKPSGSMYVCGFSEILADLKHPASSSVQALPMADLALPQQGQSWQRLGALA